jgi:hypothetical protein
VLHLSVAAELEVALNLPGEYLPKYGYLLGGRFLYAH